jgi:outer membrane protein assembly factor BamB
MKRLPALATLALLQAVALGQNYNVYTDPRVPTTEQLAQLNLKLAWKLNLPIDTRRDGIVSVQPIGEQVFVQTRAGLIYALDADTGTIRWSAQPLVGYSLVVPVTADSRFVVGARDTRLAVLNRANGKLEYLVQLSQPPTAGITLYDEPVDERYIEKRLIVNLSNNHMLSYRFPDPSELPAKELVREQFRQSGGGTEAIAPPVVKPALVGNVEQIDVIEKQFTPSLTVVRSVIPPYRAAIGDRTPSLAAVRSVVPPYSLRQGSATPSISVLPSVIGLETQNLRPTLAPALKKMWDFQAGVRLEQPALVMTNTILAISTDRTIIGVDKDDRGIQGVLTLVSPVSAPAGQYGDTFYVPSQNGDLTAYSVTPDRRKLWMTTTGGQINYKPLVGEGDILVSATDHGIYRISRTSGDILWQNVGAERALAVNPRYVYATDRVGDLLVLDRARGRNLGKLATREFTVPVVNDDNDRLYLAANNGLILALYDRDTPRPVPLRSPPPRALPKPKNGDGKNGKGKEMDKDKGKDMDKDMLPDNQMLR